MLQELYFLNHRLYSSSDLTTTTVRRGNFFFVTTHTILTIPSTSHQTIFSCSMSIPHTNYSISEKSVYFPGTQLELKPRASQISGVEGGGVRGWLVWVWGVIFRLFIKCDISNNIICYLYSKCM